ncbi:MAG TPA: PhzF family phenazine biosynthesis protein [Methanocellaceae archaeon]|jgi:trans-2,3-dihydro-3-hydroxyanthranilate isomerase
MSSYPYYIVDVFAEKKYAGNQLAVIRNAQPLSTEDMQRIANEMHFSETTFIMSDKIKNGGYTVRIFTPEEELPFAGHPTIGTAYVILHEILSKPVSKVNLNLGVGQIPVTVKNNIFWMRQVQPTFLKTFDADAMAGVLGLEASDIDGRFPIQEVSTGIPFVIVPLRNLGAIRSIMINLKEFQALSPGAENVGILTFCPEAVDKGNDIHVRVFTKYASVPEDPATGSGNGCLSAYLVKNRYFGEPKIDLKAEQGYEMGRPSILYLNAEVKDGKYYISVGGKVILVAKGELV